MIGSLTGSIQHVDIIANNILLNVNNVGYVVFVPVSTISNLTINDKLHLYIHTVVRETALDLYGFTTLDEKHFFNLLINISGVGPKSALLILSLSDVPTLQNAIIENDITILTKVSGIGKKIAQKIVLELKDKVGNIATQRGSTSEDASVMEALEAMGYKQSEAREAIKQISGETKGLNARVAEALKLIN